MKKCLFLLCPTDGLETVINHYYNCENYFYTSLGNSFRSNNKTIALIKDIVNKHKIKNICFALSTGNDIIFDALGYQNFSEIKTLKVAYNEIKKQQSIIDKYYNSQNNELGLLSNYLNFKIKEFNSAFNNINNQKLNVVGKIYRKDINQFTNIYSHLLYLEKHSFN